jgi:GT2 family glycosyltransferase
MGKSIAVLMTCHNRVQTTLACLEALFDAILPSEFVLEVFLVDDLSPDETGKIVKDKYPQINVIQGTGNLFWAKGMRLAWKEATLHKEFDYYMWLNDDTILYKNAIQELIDVNHKYKFINKVNITFGFCCSPKNPEVTTYGALFNRTKLIPNGNIQLGNLINGNVVLVPNEVYKKIGILSKKYTHGIADYDYSMRASKEGVDCVGTRIFVAECERNIEYFSDKSKSIFSRLRRIYTDVIGQSAKIYFSEFLYFRKTHFNEHSFVTYLKYMLVNIFQIFKNP